MDLKTRSLLEQSYEAQEGSEEFMRYSDRHGIQSVAVLTVYDDETASSIAHSLAPRIEGKIVVEIGGGIGLLACHLSRYAKRVFCIEANPVWASCFVAALIVGKPKNVSYLFGAADEFAGLIRADVAIFCTHSGVESLKVAGALFAPVVIDVYGEILKVSRREHDPLAMALREVI